jgi:hypothetical protein
MLSYTSLLVVCLVLSAVGYFLYKVVADSSRSVYRSKQPLGLENTPDHFKKRPAGNEYPKGKSAAFGQVGEVSTPKDFARTYPAMPAGSVDWKWEGAGVQLRELEVPHGKTANQAGHCSLYDVKPSQAATKPDPYRGRLHREETERPAGRTYKVTRKTRSSFNHDEGDLSKPWGW